MVLNEDDQRNRDRRIPRTAVKNYKNSPFEYLYNSLNDQELLRLRTPIICWYWSTASCVQNYAVH